MSTLLKPPFNPTLEDWVRILTETVQTHADAMTEMANTIDDLQTQITEIKRVNHAVLQMQLTDVVKH